MHASVIDAGAIAAGVTAPAAKLAATTEPGVGVRVFVNRTSVFRTALESNVSVIALTCEENVAASESA
jgi:hypothetical protein